MVPLLVVPDQFIRFVPNGVVSFSRLFKSSNNIE